MSRKAQRQLREAITSISHPYSRPASRTRRAEDIITLEGSSQSTPRSTPAELPVIHEPTPVYFTGIVDPSLTHSSPEHDNYTHKWSSQAKFDKWHQDKGLTYSIELIASTVVSGNSLWMEKLMCAHADILGVLATKRSTPSASAKLNPKKQTVIAKS
jgi:hypothetical protein